MDEVKQDLIIFVVIDFISLLLWVLISPVMGAASLLTVSIVVPLHRAFDLKLFEWT